MLFSRALQIHSKDLVALVGAGGKTSAMFRLAEELVAQNYRVITTTTTRIFSAQVQLAPQHLHYEPGAAFGERVRSALAQNPQLLIVGEKEQGDKTAGVPPEFVDQLLAMPNVQVVIAEVDGSRMRPLKAPAEHEPVVPARTTLLVPVAGISVIGTPLDEEHVHRAELAARVAGARIGDKVTPSMVARLIANQNGGLRHRPRTARVVVLLNQVESDARLDTARETARLLLGYREIEGVAIGAVRAEEPILETHRRVAAIVLAAGAGVRMGERVKQLLPWQGKTLVENAIETAVRSTANETVLVLGARAEQIRPVVRRTQVRVRVNKDWAEGHATSIRTGLRALTRETQAAIFINADQPRLDASVVDAVIQRYRETGADIIVPRYAGKRTSPVLFARPHFRELMSLKGEQGGRDLLNKYDAEYVDFDSEEAFFDVDTPEDYKRLTEN